MKLAAKSSKAKWIRCPAWGQRKLPAAPACTLLLKRGALTPQRLLLFYTPPTSRRGWVCSVTAASPWLADRLLFPDSGLCFLALLMDIRPNSWQQLWRRSCSQCHYVMVVWVRNHSNPSRSGVTEDEQRVSGHCCPCLCLSPVSGVTCSCVSPSFYRANSCSLCLQTGFLFLITVSAFSLNSDPRVPWVCSVTLQTSSRVPYDLPAQTRTADWLACV